MANQSELTRKDQVLARLRLEIDNTFTGGWVDGTDLANEEVGGSEGLRRVRDLKSDGYLIQERAHPDPRRAIHQYRIVQQSVATGGVTDNVNMEAPNGGPSPSRPPVGGSSTFSGEGRGKAPKQEFKDWSLESAVRAEYRAEWWLRDPKRRLIGTIALDFDRSRWFWSLKLPRYTGKLGPERPEQILGSGSIQVLPGGATPEERDANIRAAREAAKLAVSDTVHKLKEAGNL